MNGICDALFGPLAGPECRRSLGRAWVMVVRGLALLPPAFVVLGVLWAWWFWGQFKTNLSPQEILRVGILLVEGMLLTVTLVLTPALLAGSLAGEKGRSTLILLLASRVSSAEIVVARLVGQLCVIGAVLLAGLPALSLLAGLRELDPRTLGLLVGLPVAVAFGGGGLAVAASALARRGRDALLLLYLVDLLLLLVPLFGSGLPTPVGAWLEPLNPYQGVARLAAWEDYRPALLTIALWTLLGVAGVSGAAWRLRLTCLRDLEGESPRRRFFRRPAPPVSDRPLVWKERYAEQTQTFSRIVYWLGLVVVLAYVGSSIALAALLAWGAWTPAGSGWADWAQDQLPTWAEAAQPISWLVQWSFGLRAAAAIAAERQRGTWDTLLTTPLEGREIVGAKILGSLHGLRALVAAVLLAWTLGLLCGALSLATYATLVGNTLAAGVFMVVCGIHCSLACTTATRAMTFVILSWLAAAGITAVVAGLLVGFLAMVVTMLWLSWVTWIGAFTSGVRPGGPPLAWLGAAYVVGRWLLYTLAALSEAKYCRDHFDRLAGRAVPDTPRRARLRTWALKRRQKRISDGAAREA